MNLITAEPRRAMAAVARDSLLRNSLYLLSTTATMGALGFVFWLLAAHLFTPDQIGVATALISATSLISYASLLGFNNSFVYFLPRSDDRDADISTGLLLVLGAALVLGTVYALVVPTFVPRLSFVRSSAPELIGFVVLTAFCALNLATDAVFVAFRAAGYNLLVDGLVQGAVKLALPLALVGAGGYGLFAGWGIAAVAAAVCSLGLMMRAFRYRPRPRLQLARVRPMLGFSSASYVANVLNDAATLVVPLVVVARLGAGSGAYFYVALQLASLLYAVPTAVSTAMFAEGSHEPGDVSRLARRTGTALVATVVPGSLVLAAASRWMLIVFGHAYQAHAGGVLALLLLAGPLFAARAWTSILLRLTGQLRALVVSNAVFLSTTTVLALAWVGKGLVWTGAAWLVGSAVSAAVGAAAVVRGGRLATVAA